MVHALRSRRVVTSEGEHEAVVVIEGERIREVLSPLNLPRSLPVEDLGDALLLPGLVDVHTHLNEPGRTEWEGFSTGTRAAAAGGFTTVVDMPLNCLPATTNLEALAYKRQEIQGKAFIDYALWGGAVNGNVSSLLPLAKAGVAGFKAFLIYPGCDGLTEIDTDHLELAALQVAASGLPLLVHAELAAPIDEAFAELEAQGADWRSYATYLASRPDIAELDAISQMIALCRRFRFRLHIVHVSSALALPLLRSAKQEGLPITAETCPHYLHFTAEGIQDGSTLHKCAPPIRSAANREALWQGLLDGTLDLIATDHSPCPPEMKRAIAHHPGNEPGRFDEAWSGISSLAVALPAMWTGCKQRGISASQLAEWMSRAPAALAGLQHVAGTIAPGMPANLVVFDPEAHRTVTAKDLHQRHSISPYVGEVLQGRVLCTWLRGRRVFQNGDFATQPLGREHSRPTEVV